MSRTPGGHDERLLMVLQSALAWRDRGVDLSDPEVARSIIASMPPGNRDMARAMAVLLRMRHSVDSPEWAAMTTEQQSQALIDAIASMPEFVWRDGDEDCSS